MRYIAFPSFICFPPKSQMLIWNLIDRFSYSPFNPNVNLGNIQRKRVHFCKVPPEIAVSPVLIQSWTSCFTTQKFLGSLSFKELREEMECLGNVGRASQSSFPFASHPGWNLETTRTQWWLGAYVLSILGWLPPESALWPQQSPDREGCAIICRVRGLFLPCPWLVPRDREKTFWFRSYLLILEGKQSLQISEGTGKVGGEESGTEETELFWLHFFLARLNLGDIWTLCY